MRVILCKEMLFDLIKCFRRIFKHLHPRNFGEIVFTYILSAHKSTGKITKIAQGLSALKTKLSHSNLSSSVKAINFGKLELFSGSPDIWLNIFQRKH